MYLFKRIVNVLITVCVMASPIISSAILCFAVSGWFILLDLLLFVTLPLGWKMFFWSEKWLGIENDVYMSKREMLKFKNDLLQYCESHKE